MSPRCFFSVKFGRNLRAYSNLIHHPKDSKNGRREKRVKRTDDASDMPSVYRQRDALRANGGRPSRKDIRKDLD
ncbi:unnamed protein product [Caenorhabditis auriculariae]|uniref:Uncharacterized protein n=1 Tax=Caenorhabditis auriculariae TaxID=2777116 RepID=A0A8S1HH65_9PELO|nr:unnamed protein product [Caenorhabditis auriculariae]